MDSIFLTIRQLYQEEKINQVHHSNLNLLKLPKIF